MPQVSLEVRWFLDASQVSVSAAFDSAFRAASFTPGGGRERKDVYLDDDTDELGIKIRGGKKGLEVKTLVDGSWLDFTFGGRRAKAQLWSKVTSETLKLPPDQRVHTTTKTRWLRKFALDGERLDEVELNGGTSGEDPKDGMRRNVGCNVEWTLVQVPGRPDVQTFGLEAFAFGQTGAKQQNLLEKALLGTISTLERRHPALPNLANEWQELSYPSWLRAAVPARQVP